MLRKLASLFVLCSVSISYGQVIRYDTSLGTNSFMVDDKKNVKWVSSDIGYKIGALQYSGRFEPNNQMHDFKLKLDDINLNYLSSNSKNVFKLNLNDVNYSNESYHKAEIQPVHASKIYVNKKEVLSITPKGSSLSLTRIDGKDIDVLMASAKYQKLNLDYTKASKPVIMLDHWNRPYASTSYLSFSGEGFNLKLMDDYSEWGVKLKNFSVKEIDHPKRNELSLSYVDKNIAASFIDFHDVYDKSFANIQYKDFKLDYIKDDSIDLFQIQNKDTVVAHGNDQTFIQSKYKGVDYKLIDNNGKFNYDFRYGNWGYKDGSVYGNVSMKGLNIVGSFDNGIEQVKYQTVLKDKTNISMAYNNRFDAYDFYLRQNVFSIYDNSFSLIGRKNSQFKESFSLNVSNAKFNFASDVINDIYLVSFKNAASTISLLKDQRNHYLSFGNSGKFGALNLQYNLKTDKIDRFSFGYALKY